MGYATIANDATAINLEYRFPTSEKRSSPTCIRVVAVQKKQRVDGTTKRAGHVDVILYQGVDKLPGGGGVGEISASALLFDAVML